MSSNNSLNACRDVPSFLTKQKQNTDDVMSKYWQEMESLYNKRLWHQLTIKVSEFVKLPNFSIGTALIEMYNNFLADFEHRVNPLTLIEIFVPVTLQMRNTDSSVEGCGPNSTIEFLNKQKDKVKSSKEALILLDILEGQILLHDLHDLPKTRVVVERAGASLEELDGVTTVHDRYYALSSAYQQCCGNHAAYYREALRFLGCTDLKKITQEEMARWALSIGLAALLGKGVYNFGELLMHEVLSSLQNGPNDWLVRLLICFNNGNLVLFEELRSSWSKQADLSANEHFLRQKITIMALMEMAFRRPANERTMSFSEIAVATVLPLQEVEMMVMKTLSLGLIQGKLDEVSNTVQITWVQPRVLDLEQIGSMQEKLVKWTSAVDSVEKLVQICAADIIA